MANDYKWDFAIGTTSRVPDKKGYHYMIVDMDTKDGGIDTLLSYLGRLGARRFFIQQTEHGWHIFTDLIMRWDKLCQLMPCEADKSWVGIGKKRGYFFLADKDLMCFPWPVERMALRAQKKG